MKKIVLIVGLLCCLLGAEAGEKRNLLQSAADTTRLREVLLSDGSWIPYPEYSDRAGWEALLGPNASPLIRRGEELLDYEWKVIKATDYLEFDRTGNRKIMENPYFDNVEAFTDLVSAELAEGRGRFIDQIINGAYRFCEMTSWALSAHIRTRQHSDTSLPQRDNHVLALFSCELGSILSWTDYFFREAFDKVDPSISARIRAEVKERMLDRYIETAETQKWAGFKGGKLNNWNPWCNVSLLQCFLLLEGDRDRLVRAVHTMMRSVDNYLNGVAADGGCDEGPSYWGHGVGSVCDFISLLKLSTAGRVDVWGDPLLRKMGEYIVTSYVGGGWMVNFSDATARNGVDASLVYRYGRAVGSDRMCGYAAELSRAEGYSPIVSGRSLIRRLEGLRWYGEMVADPARCEPAPMAWYPVSQLLYMRCGNIFFACKGGHNGESHNHNDVGTFSLYVDDSPVLVDAGSGTYTRQTFGSKRYTIWNNRSDYHNLPDINGRVQKNGARCKASEVSVDEKGRRFSADIAGAYPPECGVRRWTRSYCLEQRRLTITDSFSIDNPAQANELHLLVWGSADISARGVVTIVSAQGRRISIEYDASRLSPEVETVSLEGNARLYKVWGPSLERLTFKARTVEPSGSYTLRVKVAQGA